VEEFTRMEEKKLPADLDYVAISGLRLEAREKLEKIRPENFGQASRISGVSPADISVLMVYMESRR
jgi:tRNA uridine 5-carboxymethylaminomethyl modification enzyme